MAGYRAAHDFGPTWFELSREMGWPHAAMTTIIRYLERTGRLSTTTENRSLDVGPAAQTAYPAVQLVHQST